MYTPPFTVSAEAINKIADISRLIERYAIRMELEDGLMLREANKIKTIHSSLAIEGNTLNEEQVRDIVNGKNVVAPLRQIQEVKNAIAAYELFPHLDAFEERDLLRAHGVMMQALVDRAGQYYDAITASSKMADSGPFINFMLGEILKTLEAHREEQMRTVPNKLQSAFPEMPDLAWRVYSLLRTDGRLTTAQMAGALGVSDRMVRKHLAALKAERLVERVGSNKAGYWKVFGEDRK